MLFGRDPDNTKPVLPYPEIGYPCLKKVEIFTELDIEAIPFCLRLELRRDKICFNDEIGFAKESSTIAAKERNIIQ